MNSTMESSAPHVAAIGFLPVETQVFLFSRDAERLRALAELTKAKAALSRQRTAQASNALVAGASRSTTKRTAVLAMANDHLPQLRVLKTQRGRAMFLFKQISMAIEQDGQQFMGLTKPPHWRTIDKVIQGLTEVSTQ